MQPEGHFMCFMVLNKSAPQNKKAMDCSMAFLCRWPRENSTIMRATHAAQECCILFRHGALLPLVMGTALPLPILRCSCHSTGFIPFFMQPEGHFMCFMVLNKSGNTLQDSKTKRAMDYSMALLRYRSRDNSTVMRATGVRRSCTINGA